MMVCAIVPACNYGCAVSYDDMQCCVAILVVATIRNHYTIVCATKTNEHDALANMMLVR